jgi:ketosteroid isomerase-like protein
MKQNGMKLPKLLADLLTAQGKYDSKAFAENFSDDAVVHDEGKIYHGKTEIRKWNEMTNAKYKTQYEPLEVSTNGDAITLTAKISGTFPGSPVTIRYSLETKDGKISSLRIE